MKQIFIDFLSLLFLVLACGFAAAAQVKLKADEKSVSEITELRRNLTDGIKKRDKKSLETFYSDGFTHTHASGQVDDKTTRIAALISGEPTIESAEVDEINIRFYGKTTAVAAGQSTVKNKDETAARYRWTVVFVKTGKNWQVAASQATRLAEK